ncbi:MAG TPA: GvpL/GvpF family gas vesicle protein [Candidatus Angelobacter sp.]|nr:GvpL/GvpF family gas vesicle protein [Candidatus Angelobacter sp.]
MSRVLAYCGFQLAPEIALPAIGVNAQPVQLMSSGDLGLLWSEVEWPFAPDQMQRSALEFHAVVRHVFTQTAVIPFRLLSVFEDQQALRAFVAENQERFLADLERLKGFVQMECVVYPAPGQAQAGSSSGKAYLEKKAVAMRSSEGFAQAVRGAVAHLSHEVRVREGKNGTRIFVLVERDRESDFREAVSAVPLPEYLSRRISGPWPAAEFLSDQVKAPEIVNQNIAGQKIAGAK